MPLACPSLPIRSAAVAAVAAVFLGTVPGAALADDLSFRLANGSSSTLIGVYASPVGVEDWEENMVAKPMAPGESAEASIAGGSSVCRYDLRIEFPDTDPFVEDDVNLCGVNEYTVQDDN